ncbi:transposase [Paracoccus sediminilitoris]|uniref:transposase n=1 Tax=Paracoccus sediminilitoris TaxID=2202419 RepID=UPI003FA6C7F3
MADRGHDGGRVRKAIDARNVVAVIALRTSRKRRVAVDCKLPRLSNLVQRCFGQPKHARPVAIRYDKTAESLHGSIVIASIRPWLRSFSTRPEAAGWPTTMKDTYGSRCIGACGEPLSAGLRSLSNRSPGHPGRGVDCPSASRRP